MKTAEECRLLSQTCRTHVCNVLASLFNLEHNTKDERLKLVVDGIVQAAVLETAALIAGTTNTPNVDLTADLPRRTG